MTWLQQHHNNKDLYIFASLPDSRDQEPSVIMSKNSPVKWMHSAYDEVSCLSLREITIPGSRDAGMSKLCEISGAATPWNTLMQTIDSNKQLRYGSRCPDIRSVRSGGGYRTGHYGFDAGAGHKRNGQSLRDVIDQVFEFAATNKELIMLGIAHSLNTDDQAGEHDSELTQEQ